MSNFAFLQTEWPDLYRTARRVEEYAQSDPRAACFYARRALETAIQWLYAHDKTFRIPYDDSLAALLNEASFRAHVSAAIYTKADLIRRTGNVAVHSRKSIPAQSALGAAIELRHILYWLARSYTQGDPATIPSQFDEGLLPAPAIYVIRQSAEQLQQLTERKELYSNFQDEGGLIQREVGLPYMTTGVNVAQYRKKVEQFIREHEDYWVIYKIRWAIPLELRDLAALEDFFYQSEAVGGRRTRCWPWWRRSIGWWGETAVGRDNVRRLRFRGNATQPIQGHFSDGWLQPHNKPVFRARLN